VPSLRVRPGSRPEDALPRKHNEKTVSQQQQPKTPESPAATSINSESSIYDGDSGEKMVAVPQKQQQKGFPKTRAERFPSQVKREQASREKAQAKTAAHGARSFGKAKLQEAKWVAIEIQRVFERLLLDLWLEKTTKDKTRRGTEHLPLKSFLKAPHDRSSRELDKGRSRPGSSRFECKLFSALATGVYFYLSSLEL
jgi:hypothetical protein